jgi:hypothetical protein
MTTGVVANTVSWSAPGDSFGFADASLIAVLFNWYGLLILVLLPI